MTMPGILLQFFFSIVLVTTTDGQQSYDSCSISVNMKGFFQQGKATMLCTGKKWTTLPSSLERVHSYYPLKYIKLLHVDKNQISKIRFDSLIAFSKVEELVFNGNKLTEMPVMELAYSYHLKVLRFRDNAIARIRHILNGPYKNTLKHLDISGNHLKEIPGKQLSPLLKLEILSLQHNRIKVVPSKLFHGSRFPSLKLLALNNNQITKISDFAFTNLLKYNFDNSLEIHLQHNKLKMLKAVAFQGSRDVTLHVFQNPLLCDCNLEWVWWLLLGKTDYLQKRLGLSGDKTVPLYVCHLPHNRQLVKLKDLKREQLCRAPICRNAKSTAACSANAICNVVKGQSVMCRCKPGFIGDGHTCQRSVNGVLSSWGRWKGCSVACGGGVRQRTRPCTNTKEDSNFIADCNAVLEQREPCNLRLC